MRPFVLHILETSLVVQLYSYNAYIQLYPPSHVFTNTHGCHTINIMDSHHKTQGSLPQIPRIQTTRIIGTSQHRLWVLKHKNQELLPHKLCVQYHKDQGFLKQKLRVLYHKDKGPLPQKTKQNTKMVINCLKQGQIWSLGVPCQTLFKAYALPWVFAPWACLIPIKIYPCFL